MKIAEYLGKHVSTMLRSAPFKDWQFKRSVDDDLDETIVDYVFSRNGLEVRCDPDEKVSAIYLFSDKYNGFDDSTLDIPFSKSSAEVRAVYGAPEKSGPRRNDPILGEYGAWDRFALPGYTIHFQYRTDAESISQITLMRSDTAP